MAINTIERRRSAIDFGKGPRGTGMPIPSGTIDAAERSHILNLYPGISPVSFSFFFWRNRGIPTTTFHERTTPSSTWRKATDADEDRFRKRTDMRDS